MKRILSIILTSILILTLFAGCTKTKKLSEGKDNDKLVGAWILINETDGVRRTIRYWEFKNDNTVIMCDYVQTAESDTINNQLYEEAPVGDAFKTYYIDKDFVTQEGFSDRIERYTYSYSDGHGLECQKNENNVVTFTEEEGWHFEFINENKFYLTTEASEYHGYRLKVPLLNN